MQGTEFFQNIRITMHAAFYRYKKISISVLVQNNP